MFCVIEQRESRGSPFFRAVQWQRSGKLADALNKREVGRNYRLVVLSSQEKVCHS